MSEPLAEENLTITLLVLIKYFQNQRDVVAVACKINHLHGLKQSLETVCIDTCRFGNLRALLYFLYHFECVTFVSLYITLALCVSNTLLTSQTQLSRFSKDFRFGVTSQPF